MITLRPAGERGHANHGWLDTHHTFSFANYYDPNHMGFRALRVINDDRVAPGRGFGAHAHQDMEIITYVLDGALEHRDSMGNGSVMRPGDVQRMSAGSGLTHSEYNPSDTEPVHFLQIWITPEERGIAPGYEQKTFTTEERRGRFRTIASRNGAGGAVTIHQDASILAAVLEPGERATYEPAAGRYVWLHVATGSVTLGDRTLSAGDGAAITDEQSIEITGAETADVLLFDLA